MGRAGCAVGSGGEQIAWNNVTRHAVKDAEFARVPEVSAALTVQRYRR